MSRENQNLSLQAAVVVFSMLTAVLGASTFVVFRKCDGLSQLANASHEEAQRAAAAALAAGQDNRELRRLIGVGPGEKLDAIRAEFDRDIASCANLPEQSRFYRPALAYFRDLAAEHSGTASRTRGEVENWKTAYAGREASKDGQIRQFSEAVANTGRDARQAQSDRDKEREQRLAESKEFEEKLNEIRREANGARATADKELETLKGKYADLRKAHDDLQKQLAELLRQNFTEAQGRVRSVSLSLRKAWIDLGSADAVRRFLGFNVYPATASNLNRSTQKGRIEVTNVVGDHLAEADIVEDKLADPMMPGDKIHSPVLRVGQR